MLAVVHREVWLYAGPWIAVWTISPLVAWWLSQPICRPALRLSENQHRFLEKLSRKTWRYFEEFVVADDNWLPPDNIQQNPSLVVASRTSPTNIGMALLADLAAYDFGYVSAGQFLTRTQRTFETLSRMERYRGHFFNWYDTRSLAPLSPRYVSMVDSGNLAANLLVLGSGCAELSEARVMPPRMLGGLCDTLRVLLDVAQGKEVPLVGSDVLRLIERQIEELEQTPSALGAAHAVLSRLTVVAAELTAAAGTDAELAWWASALERSSHDHHTDLLHLAAWQALPPPPAETWKLDSGGESEQLNKLREELKRLDNTATLRDVANLQSTALPLLEVALEQASSESKDWLVKLQACAGHRSGACRYADPSVGGSRHSVPRPGRYGFRLTLQLRATCSPSATTSASGDSMQASMIYWPPRRGCPASSSLRRASSARSTGSHWAVC